MYSKGECLFQRCTIGPNADVIAIPFHLVAAFKPCRVHGATCHSISSLKYFSWRKYFPCSITTFLAQPMCSSAIVNAGPSQHFFLLHNLATCHRQLTLPPTLAVCRKTSLQGNCSIGKGTDGCVCPGSPGDRTAWALCPVLCGLCPMSYALCPQSCPTWLLLSALWSL